MKKYTCLLIILIIIIHVSCYKTPRLNLDKGFIPVVPTNFSQVNSEYDDYNSDIDITFADKAFSLIFSTNRFNNGGGFDFINYLCLASSSQVTGKFMIKVLEVESGFIDSLNSSGNELGPCIMYDHYANLYSEKELSDAQKRFFYATDLNGNLDIYLANYTISNYEYSIIGEIKELSELNSNFDDAYPTIRFDELNNKEKLYFTSNRDNKFDIYEASGNENKLIDQSSNIEIVKMEKLSSESDDKCPYIKGNTMVFTSNRQGGFGGFDLWYSIYDGTEWSEPKNFGEKINTEYDEYRPIICEPDSVDVLNNFFNNLMIFSSNRPGGKGGFDLYYVGINKTLK